MAEVDPDGYTPQPLPERLRDAARRRGLRPVAGELTRWAGHLVAGLPAARDGEGAPFVFEGRRHRYCHGAYKRSWLTERAVEVPIARAEVAARDGGRVLEVGHVLGHYGPHDHLVVDRYEQAPGVRNLDVLDLADLGEFDLVVAVSTLEHVGWDEEPRETDRAIAAAHALRARLAPGGRLVLTVPAGYNPHLDAGLRGGALAGAHVAGLRRTGGGPSWTQVDPELAWAAPYDFLAYSARGVLVVTLDA